MKHSILALALAAAFAGVPVAHAVDAPALGTFGIDLSARDTTVKPGDDFDTYANGQWKNTYQLKDYEARYGSFNMLSDQAEARVRAIIEGLAADPSIQPGSEAQKIRDYYASYMDTAARDKAGIAPLQPLLTQIGAIRTPAQLTAAFGRAAVDGTMSPLGMMVAVDRKDPQRHLLTVGVSGLGMPDRDYYLNDAERFAGIRTQYLEHIATMLGFAGVKPADATAKAKAILELETRIARAHWDRAAQRDRDKTYNVLEWAQLLRQYPGYDWAAHLKAQGIAAAPAQVNVAMPSAVEPMVGIVRDTPLPLWRDYLTFHAVRNHAPLLSTQIDEAAFAFTGKVLQGQTAQRETWKRGVAMVAGMGGLGDAVGKLYVAQHFKPESKAAMDTLVENLRKALRGNIVALDWMGEDTKAEAYRKLETFRPKVGYTEKWRDYSSANIVPGDLVANARAMRAWGMADRNRRLGQVPDREEWGMTPQTVNAYYNSSFNEIVFPAGILQPPFFDVHADPAVNYGAIGAVIGHEMGHGFDDQGSKSDYAGVQRNWWTDADRGRFEELTKKLGAQYAQFCPMDGQCINPGLTMGENIGDLGGLSMAYAAYRLSLDGKEAPVIDGLTGDQRFFLAWAQVWKAKQREEFTLNQLKTDPHSPARYRINGPVRNMDAWYAAFDVKPGDDLYLAPEQRVRIW